MRYILDTHTVIWFIANDPKLPTGTKDLIKNIDNSCFVSTASLWEMAIKVSLGKLDLKTDLNSIFTIIEQSRFDILPITSDHILTVGGLPFHHRDPFDRMIIALNNDGEHEDHNQRQPFQSLRSNNNLE